MVKAKTYKILIAEDEKPLARALALKLSDENFKVDIVYDGEQVLEKVKQGRYDAILMDLMMPNHDGFLTIEDIKKSKDTTPIIVMSNLSQDTDIQRAKQMGAIHYFVKGDSTLSEIVTYIKKTIK